MGGGGGEVQERKINVSCRFHPSPARHFNYFDGPCGGKFKRINKGKEVTLTPTLVLTLFKYLQP